MALDEPRPASGMFGSGDLARLRVPSAERVARKPRASLLPGFAWFALIAALAMAGGWWLVYVAQIFVGDAMARVVQAKSVVLSRDPHLAAVGFVWPPLPSIAEVPFVLALQKFTAPIFAGQIVSALFAGALAAALWGQMKRSAVPTKWAIVLTLVVMLNPLVFYSSINGMTEVIFLFFAVAAAGALSSWDPRESRGLLVAGLLLGASFFVRYEAVAFAAAGVLSVVVMQWRTPRWRERVGAVIIAFVAPVSYMVILWIVWTWLFLGNPFAFLTGAGSNLYFTESIRLGQNPVLSPLYGDPVATARWVLIYLVREFPPFVPLVAIALAISLAKRDRGLFILVVFAGVGPAFLALQVYRGQLLSWSRFWIYAIPFSAILLTAVVRDWRPKRRNLAYAAATAVFVLSGVSTLHIMGDTIRSAPDENTFARAVRSADLRTQYGTEYAAIKEATEVLDEYMDEEPEALALVDGLVHGGVLLFTRHTGKVAFDADRDFSVLTDQPVDRVRFILIPGRQPSGAVAQTPLVERFSTLHSRGAPWAEYLEEFPAYSNSRLYRVYTSKDLAEGKDGIPPPNPR
ncbi:MAG: hypothetical protein C4558_07305 [Dehalococcoidia bacterium]|nr:MAG: hypothetical protein C4558_07305 [Dehalococcoidia bacterium]